MPAITIFRVYYSALYYSIARIDSPVAHGYSFVAATPAREVGVTWVQQAPGTASERKWARNDYVGEGHGHTTAEKRS